ncbi:MAG TPA: glutathione S-transferase family protein [Gammaproteobacteria bacterium]|nr:glutathione S-transferase family protein [Gammaproteobacteria bacterium]
MKPKLISFKICPFVQRSVIVLEEKGADYDIEYIDIQDPPEWFKELSPLGKVPILQVGDAVLFESAVIMEYLDETHPPSLHPADPLQKAGNRAWTEYASECLFAQHGMITADSAETFEEKKGALTEKLQRLEGLVAGPFFNGGEMALVDVAYAPLFMRMDLLEQWFGLNLLEGLPKLAAWRGKLLERESVRTSVVADFPDLFRTFIRNMGPYLAGKLE